MKNIIVMCCVLLIASVGVCNAQTKTRAGEVSFDTGGRGVVFKCVSPRDVLRGAGCYVLGVFLPPDGISIVRRSGSGRRVNLPRCHTQGVIVHHPLLFPLRLGLPLLLRLDQIQ